MSTWPSQLITVQMNQTPKQREVWAMIIGPFGVHPSVDESGWSVTHLRTGIRVGARRGIRDLTERHAAAARDGDAAGRRAAVLYGDPAAACRALRSGEEPDNPWVFAIEFRRVEA